MKEYIEGIVFLDMTSNHFNTLCLATEKQLGKLPFAEYCGGQLLDSPILVPYHEWQVPNNFLDFFIFRIITPDV